MIRALFCLVASLLILPSASRADEPKKEPEKKEPEKKKPAELPANLDLAKVLEMVQKLREAQARMRAAENLRKLKLAPQRPAEEPKKDPARQPSDRPGDLGSLLLPFMEQDNLYFRAFSVGGPDSRLGVSLERVGPVVASQLKLPKDQGRVVGAIKKDSPADKGGLKQHDILLEINGKAVPGSDDEFSKLLPNGKNAKVTITVLREGQKTEIKNVPVAEKPDGTSNTILLAPSDPRRAFEWNYLGGLSGHTRVQSTPALPRGYEVISHEPVLTTVFREDKRFTVRLQEGTLAITVVGTSDGKKTTVEIIKVQEGGSTERFTSMDKVPVEYRDKAARLLQLGENKLGSDW